MKLKLKEVVHELKHHIPFTAVASFLAVAAAFVIIRLLHISLIDLGEAFEIAHPIHVIFSAMVTSAIYYKYKKNIIPAILVGISGAIILGSLSDIILPWLGGTLFQFNTLFHLPVIESPSIIIGAAFLGSLIGITTGLTKIPHFFHVLLSVLASLLYLSAFAFTSMHSIFAIISVAIIVFISVIIPCCVSDILYPFFFLGEKIKKCKCN